MKKILSFLILFALFQPLARADRQLVDRVIAVVNNDAITQSELDSVLRGIYQDFKTQYKGEEFILKLNEARQKLLNQLIEDKLVFQEAERQGLTVSQAEIGEQMEELKSKFASDEELEKALQSEGVTLSMMEERVRRQTLIRKLHAREIRSKVVVSPREVEDYYQNHPEQFSSEDSLKVRSLTIKKSELARQKGLTDEAAKNKIMELRGKIVSGGEDFGELAKAFSQDTRAAAGGLSEWVERGTMIPVIDDVIFALKSGEVSEMVETPMGYHLFRVEERKEGYKKNFEEVRDEIHYVLFNRKADERFNEWMMDLKRSAYISIR